ncbi:tripartite tricarboxylate transporter permease [Fusobacterium perfoetens]|uniref:tripartite tricarboxylate transporter permease n=1 Tax=Fusobacterium perfoetens TaxID=852 RepID=UPI00047F7B88|nr:tripartite tricarboxylate transporter permease [Fusobacterium perfoetens]MCI6152635.1 tripartite tricarboxylate transporter permease [Fusobacterium perfoetens]MDY3237642.1 tripartite tricarboxylate transporter permease [Fusobacterium perfoetens]
MFNLLFSGLKIILVPSTFLLITAGTVLGVIFGALPGVSASMAVALALPFAYAMNPVIAIAFLVSVYCASITGGGITAILFKIPGTPSSAPTTFDGYPMAQRGEAGKALGFSLVASAIGGMVAAFAMALISPQLSSVALKFGPSELFAVSFLGLSVLSCLDSDNIVKTLISGLLGLFLACIGMDPMLGIARFTWGSSTLLSGIEMIPIMIGLFAVTEVLKQTGKKKEKLESTSGEGEAKVKTVLPSFKELWETKATMTRSSILGTIVGILPGAGATIASFLSYAIEKKINKKADKLGTGIADGIVASEAANNAATGGSMVPLLSLGIPGGNAAAIMMTALVIKGVQIGPLLVKTQPDYLASVFGSMFITNIVMVIVAMLVAKIFAKILAVPYTILGPVIIMLATIGAYALKNNTGDILLMTTAGILGYLFVKLKYNSAALVLGLVLGQMSESNFRRAYTLTNGDFIGIFSKPITAILVSVCVIMLVYPLIKMVLFNKKNK